MNVLLFTTTFPSLLPGDATPPHVSELAKRYVKKGVGTIILTPRVPGTSTYQEREGMKIYRYPYFFLSKRELLADGAIMGRIKQNKLLLLQVPFFLLAGLFSLMRVIKKENIDIIHCFWVITNGFICSIYKRFFDTKIPLMITSLGADAYINSGIVGSIAGWMRKVTMPYVQFFTTQSSAIMEAFSPDIEKYSVPHEVVPLGTDFTRFVIGSNEKRKQDLDISSDKNVLLFVGRMVEKKGLTYLLQSMSAVLETHPNTHLVVVGNGPLEDEANRQIKEYGLSDDVSMIGGVPYETLPERYALADVLVGPSIIARDGDTEGLPIVFLEAMATGVPVVLTDLPGNYDVHQSGVNGYMVKQKDVKSLSEGIIKTLETEWNPEKIRQSIMQTHSRKASVARYYTLLQGLKHEEE